MIETKTRDFGTTLGLIDDTMPAVGTRAYEKMKVSKLMDEDCISMRNEPIDPLETIEDMQFDLGLPEGENNNRNQALYESHVVEKGGFMKQMDKLFQ